MKSMDKLMNQVKQYRDNWPNYRATIYRVDFRHVEDSYHKAPNDDTKALMLGKMHFFSQLINGYEYLSRLAKVV